MVKSSTPVTREIKEQFKETLSPRKSTVEFLKQFARIYTYNNMTTPQLGSFMAN